MGPSRALFQIAFPGPETTESVRRSISRIDRSAPGLKKILAVCERLKLKHTVGFFLRDSWAHIGIPDKKIAIFMRQSTDTAMFRRIKDGWDSKGWKCLFITHRHAEQYPEDELTAQLADALKFCREGSR